MSRAGGSGAIVVKATNNVYTVLVVVGIVVEIVGLVYIWMQAMALHGKPLFSFSM
jgi:hypothetical protein